MHLQALPGIPDALASSQALLKVWPRGKSTYGDYSNLDRNSGRSRRHGGSLLMPSRRQTRKPQRGRTPHSADTRFEALKPPRRSLVLIGWLLRIPGLRVTATRSSGW